MVGKLFFVAKKQFTVWTCLGHSGSELLYGQKHRMTPVSFWLVFGVTHTGFPATASAPETKEHRSFNLPRHHVLSHAMRPLPRADVA